MEHVCGEVQLASVLKPTCEPREHIPYELVARRKRSRHKQHSQSSGVDPSKSRFTNIKQEDCSGEQEVSDQGYWFECC